MVAFVAVFTLHAIFSIWQGISVSRQWVQVEEVNWIQRYFGRQDYLLGFSYALAGSFTVYAFLKFLSNRGGSMSGVVGGVTLTGVLYFGGCFLLGCCGSPILAVYLSLFGSSFLGFTKPLTLIVTLTSIAIGYLWLEKKSEAKNTCCEGNEKMRGGESCAQTKSA